MAECFFGLTAGLLILLAVYLLFVAIPISLWADAKCSEKGFAKSSVTWNWQVYCFTLRGAVETPAVPLKDIH
jgi:hypothetical protein